MVGFSEYQMVDQPEVKSEQVNGFKNNPNEAEQNITCNGCGMSPIVGVLYKCSVTPNFFFCA